MRNRILWLALNRLTQFCHRAGRVILVAQFMNANSKMRVNHRCFAIQRRSDDVGFEAAHFHQQRHKRPEHEAADMRPERDPAAFSAVEHHAPELLQQPERQHDKRGRAEFAAKDSGEKNKIDKINFGRIFPNHERAHDRRNCAGRANQRRHAFRVHHAMRDGRQSAADKIKMG